MPSMSPALGQKPPRTFLEGLRLCRNPFLVMHHFRAVRGRQAFIAAAAGISDAEAQRVVDEVLDDDAFNAELVARRQRFLGAPARSSDFMWLNGGGSQFFQFVIHYALVRLLQPQIVVETGGTPGSSSAFMLRAMERNGRGKLVTLDLPSLGAMGDIKTEGEKIWYEKMPTDLPPGWMVPESLRSRHHQVLGDARQTLPEVVKTYPQFDIFIHDSDHSYEHMTWEYRTAWPHIKPGGLLCSDDIRIHGAWPDFAREVGQPMQGYLDFGVMHKPAA